MPAEVVYGAMASHDLEVRGAALRQGGNVVWRDGRVVLTRCLGTPFVLWEGLGTAGVRRAPQDMTRVLLLQAFGAVAPQRQPVQGRFLKVAGAMAMAMAITALVVLAGSPADMDASAMQAEWSTNFVDPQRVALAQQMMSGNSALK
jgi:hypothetical protein